MSEKKKPVRSRTTEMTIGKTIYIVTATYNENARETAEQKLLRLVAGHVAVDINNGGMGRNAEKKTCYLES